MKFNKHLSLYVLIFLFSTHSYSLCKESTVSKLSDIKIFNEKETNQINNRYPDFHKNDQLFTPYQFQSISNLKLAQLLGDLIIHPTIQFDDTETLITFADQVRQSGLDFKALEPRINKYLLAKQTLFEALRKAVERETFHQFKILRNKEVLGAFDSFVQNITKLKLSDPHQAKIINAYAVCVDSFNHAHHRESMKPKICDPVDDYPKPRSKRKIVSVRESLAHEATREVMAYRALIAHARDISERQKLTSFEKVKMAKCIAEQSLKFFEPSRHLFQALKKTCEMDEKSPEEAFFMESGVCGNFSGLTYNIAKQLGLKDKIFLTKKGVHIYLEFTERNNWYHAHPFNSQTSCDIIKFKN